jgi:hypothetical protein
VLVPDYDAQPQKQPPLLPHGAFFVLVFSFLACLAAGFLIPLGVDVWGPQRANGTARLAATGFGMIVLVISAFLTALAFIISFTGSPLRKWQRLLLILRPALAVLMAAFTVAAGMQSP